MTSKLRLIAVCLAGLWLAHQSPATAQDKSREKYGFVRLLNAVSAGTGNLTFLIDGAAVNETGYKLGGVTGGIALKPAGYRVAFRKEGVKEGETSIRVAADDTTILIPFAEQVPATDDEPAHWAIRILRLKQHAVEDARVASFVSVSRQPEITIEVRQSDRKWEAVMIKRLGIARIPIKQSKGYMPVKSGDLVLSAISVGGSGNYVSVLYDDENGNLKSRTFQDYKYLSAD
jgi:hypothetical protein